MKNIPLTLENSKFAFAELDWTHDYSGVKIGTVLINRHGEAHLVTRITQDECGRDTYWSGLACLATQYSEPHNMLTKSPFYAFEYTLD